MTQVLFLFLKNPGMQKQPLAQVNPQNVGLRSVAHVFGQVEPQNLYNSFGPQAGFMKNPRRGKNT